MNGRAIEPKKERIKKVEKKFKFSDNPTLAKAVYGAIIAILCITAIVVGIVAANNRKDNEPGKSDTPPVTDGTDEGTGDGEGNGDGTGGEGEEENQKQPLTFIAPVSGEVAKGHSMSTPVFSETLEAWKIHTGIDITTAEGADVFAAAPGKVSAVYSDAMLGVTVEITHDEDTVTRYSNLAETVSVSVGSEVGAGTRIGTVGDSAISELADEAHLHFEMLVGGSKVNPLDYISEESKRVSLGISDEEAA